MAAAGVGVSAAAGGDGESGVVCVAGAEQAPHKNAIANVVANLVANAISVAGDALGRGGKVGKLGRRCKRGKGDNRRAEPDKAANLGKRWRKGNR